ncbi:MAG TPA: hypothetical protein VL307_11615 [Chitinophagaceae bacterium]|nr:hypothetical protein [Chitinophagaceae bacterium]
MDKMLLKNITIFLTVDEQTIDSYFNVHDPSPIYKRQLSHEFEKYIASSIVAIKRHSVLRYKLVCTKETDRQFVEPLIHSIRRHFSIQKVIKEAEFVKFKKGAYKLLFISMAIVVLGHLFKISLLNDDNRFHSIVGNAMDIFSWVILWTPIDKLVFFWNPFLKEISILDRLTNAEIVVSVKHSANGLVLQERKYA